MAKRQDRFVWKENDVTLYDKDGNKIDPKTGKAVKDDNDPYSAELKKLLIAEQKRKRKANG